MSIREIENSIVSKLKIHFPDFLVQGFPDKPEEFRLLHPIGAVLVHYKGGSYTNSNALYVISQEKRLEFTVTIVTRNLRDNEGAYETLEKVKQVLCGYQIPECSKLTPTKEGFLSEISGIWQYEIGFTLTTISIEDMEEIT